MKRTLILLLIVAGCILCAAFSIQITEPITKKDVQFKIPAGFPKPSYDFKNNILTPEIFMLGRKLFYDPILSSDSSTSCQTCHQRVAAFAHIDHSLSHGVEGRIGIRNVPALQNMIWKDSYMADGGVNNLEVQPINPITNPVEMNESLSNVIQKLNRNVEYRMLFKKAFKDNIINSEKMLKALAQFTGLMISSNSKYDRYIAGKDTFSTQEKNGLQLFRLKCSGCHKEPLFTDNTYRNNGLKPDSTLNDIGRGKITNMEADNYKFKVPGLRNIEMTFPYMHDGRFKKLKDVLNHYNEIAESYAIKDNELKKIEKLTETERKDIIAFLLTLTDKDFLNDKRFADPNFK